MKKVIVIGANGLTAQQVISRLIKQPNVQLSLFVRQASKLHTVHDDKQINIFEGDAINMDDLRAAIQGQDIVIRAPWEVWIWMSKPKISSRLCGNLESNV